MIYEAVRNGEFVKVKKCTRCLKYKSVDNFYYRRDGRYESHCKRCINSHREKKK